MPKVEVTLPDLEAAILETLRKQFIEPALAVAGQVPSLIKDKVILDNKDVDDNEMPKKIPRPKSDPQNNPNFAVLDSGNMLDTSRWVIEQVSETEVEVIYSPPDYFDYLVTKDPESGGRPWLLPDRINPDVFATIEELLAVAVMSGDANEPDGWTHQGVPEGFEIATTPPRAPWSEERRKQQSERSKGMWAKRKTMGALL
jgi:hypothetical protein